MRVVVLAHPLVGHELVDVVEPLVVAEIGDRAAVGGQRDGGALVLEPAERGALARGGGLVVRVELDHPAEAVRLVRVLGEVEALVGLVPLAVAGRDRVHGVDAVPLEGGLVGLRHSVAVHEVLVEVLLAVQRGAPRRQTARAVVERAEHLPAGRVGRGPEQRRAGRRSGEPEGGRRREPPVVAPALPHRPPLAGVVDPLDLDHGQPVGGHRDLALLDGGAVGAEHAGEHQFLVGVLVVDHQQRALGTPEPGPLQRDHGHVVVVVAELLRLGGRRLVVRVEPRRAGHHRVAPADHHGVVVAVRDDDAVQPVRRHGREGQRRAARLRGGGPGGQGAGRGGSGR